MEKWRVLQKFNMSEKQYKRLVKRLERRHPNERWIDEHFAQNGERVVYLKLELVEWIEEVYLNNNLFYLDAEIVYDVIKHDLPKLKDVLQQIIDDLKISNQAID